MITDIFWPGTPRKRTMRRVPVTPKGDLTMKKCDTISPSVQNKTITVDGVKYRLTGGVKDLPDGTRYEAIKPDLTRTMLTEAQVEAQLGDRG